MQDRQIGWFGALENFSDVNSDLAIAVHKVGCVADKTARFGEFAITVYRGQLIAGRQRHQLIASADEQRILSGKERACPLLSEGGEGRVDFSLRSGARDNYLSLDRACRFLHLAQLAIGIRISRIHQHSDRRGAGDDFIQQPQTLGLQFRPEQAEPRDIAAGAVEARDDASLDRIGGANEDDRDRRGRRYYRFRRIGAAGCDDHRNLAADQIGH